VNVQRNVARAIIGAVAISGVIGMITLICFAIGIPNLPAVASSPTPIAYISTYWFGSAFTRIFLVTVAYSVFALMVVQIAAIGRLIFSLSRDNMFPASKFFAGVEEKRKTPIAALTLTTLLYIAVMVFAAIKGNAYVDLIGATPVCASIVYLMVVVAYWLRRNTIPKSPAFDLGKWAVPLLVLSLIWEVYLIFDFTLPSIFHGAAEVFVGAQIVAAAWYIFGLRGRLRRGEAGQALSKGKLAGAHVMAATAGAAPAGAAQPEAEPGE
jgi:amino acid transporter